MSKKKLILLALLAIITASCKKVDPLRYKGCLIVEKSDFPYFLFTVKLTPSLRDSLKTDYYSFYTNKYEWDKYEKGDTIK